MSEPQRRLAAIMFSDIVGYSKMMGDDERATLELLREHNDIQLSVIEAHGGKVLKFIGDAILSSYSSASNAVRCGLALQKALAARNKEKGGKPIFVRIGIHIGDVVEQGNDIFGDGVNVAARIQPLAEPGGICVSKAVHDMVSAQADVRMESLGERSLKNIKNKVEIFRVETGVSAPRRRRSWKPAMVAGALALAAAGLWTTRSKWLPGARPLPRDKRFAVFVAPFHGSGKSAAEDGQAMKALIEERLTAQLGALNDIRVISNDAPAPHSKDEAEALGAKLGANLVVWGDIVSLGGQTEIQPFLSMVGTSFREQESSPLDVAETGKNQLELRKAEASELANLIVISAAWYYGVLDSERGLQLLGTISPPSAQSVVAEGYIRIDEKKWDEAGAIFKKALAMDPKSATAYNGLGNVARAHDDYKQAEVYYGKAVALHRDWPNSYYNLGQTYEMEGRIDDALAEYKRVTKLAPKDGVAHRSLANVYDQLGQYAQSAEEYRVSVENCKPDLSSSFGDLFYWVALMRSGKEEQAAKFVSELVAKSGLKAPNLWPYYIAWFYAGRYPEEDVLKTVEASPAEQVESRRCEAYYFLGMYHLLRARREGQAELELSRGYFQKCVATKVFWFIEYRRAKAELSRMPGGRA